MGTDIRSLPIGVFDSGVGGLTVLAALRQRLPQEHILYLGDTARLPYGTKSPDTVSRYALQAAGKLVERGIKMLVVACNTATSAALPALTAAFAPLPVVGVVEPGAAAAVAVSRNAHIAVIATEGTILGGAYQRAIRALCPTARITGQPCTLFVPLAEEGWLDGPLVEGIARRYLDPIFLPANSVDKGSVPDTLLLGCTHFPLLAPALMAVLGPAVVLVDSAATTAASVANILSRHSLLRPADTAGGHAHFCTTDDAARFARVGGLFLGRALSASAVETVDL